MIPMADMEDRRIYRIQSRNLVVGVWRASTRGFIGVREKFKHLYLFEEYHYDTGPPVGTARPLEALDMVPDDVEVDVQSPALFELLKPLDAEIHRVLTEQWEIERLEAESQRWAPWTREKVEKEERLEAVRVWHRGERAKGTWDHVALTNEMIRRFREAQGERDAAE